MYGYTQNILRVDLTTRDVKNTSLSEDTARNYLGGRGLGARILFDELRAGIDPLSPENELVFGTGPFTATKAPSNGRMTVMAKSPLTGI